MIVSASRAKHTAGSLRIIGMAQFAAYGYKALSLSSGSMRVVVFSASVYILLEGLSLFLLSKGDRNG